AVEPLRESYVSLTFGFRREDADTSHGRFFAIHRFSLKNYVVNGETVRTLWCAILKPLYGELYFEHCASSPLRVVLRVRAGAEPVFAQAPAQSAVLSAFSCTTSFYSGAV